MRLAGAEPARSAEAPSPAGAATKRAVGGAVAYAGAVDAALEGRAGRRAGAAHAVAVEARSVGAAVGVAVAAHRRFVGRIAALAVAEGQLRWAAVAEGAALVGGTAGPVAAAALPVDAPAADAARGSAAAPAGAGGRVSRHDDGGLVVRAIRAARLLVADGITTAPVAFGRAPTGGTRHVVAGFAVIALVC
jgi:hypothetical protein